VIHQGKKHNPGGHIRAGYSILTVGRRERSLRSGPPVIRPFLIWIKDLAGPDFIKFPKNNIPQ
jgi:hypothetical protein